jgi:arylformamidase
MNFNLEKYIDISMELNANTLVWVEDKAPELIPLARQPEAPVNFTWLNFGAHAGTHVDAPYYLFQEKWTSDQIPLSRLMGPCQVLDLTQVESCIEIEDLQQIEIKHNKIFLKTKNSFDPLLEFHGQHITLSAKAAKYLVALGIETVGYDYQTFERGGSNEIHHIFLNESITLLDNLRLIDAEAKEYFLMCLPIKVTGIDAAPARAILFEKNA